MLYTQTLCYSHVSDCPINPVVVPPATATDIIGATFLPGVDIAYILLFNKIDSADICYISLGQTCDPNTNWSAQIAKGAMYSIPRKGRVSVYSTGGCTIGVAVGISNQ